MDFDTLLCLFLLFSLKKKQNTTKRRFGILRGWRGLSRLLLRGRGGGARRAALCPTPRPASPTTSSPTRSVETQSKRHIACDNGAPFPSSLATTCAPHPDAICAVARAFAICLTSTCDCVCLSLGPVSSSSPGGVLSLPTGVPGALGPEPPRAVGPLEEAGFPPSDRRRHGRAAPQPRRRDAPQPFPLRVREEESAPS